MKKLAIFSLFCLLAPSAHSQIFKVTGNCGSSGNPTLCSALQTAIQDEINKDSPSVEIDKYATGMAKANKISAKGGTTDYANKFDVALLGANLNMGLEADVTDADNIENTAAGVAIAPALLLGINLGVLPIDKIGSVEMKDIDLFFSFMSYNNDKFIDQDSLIMGGDFSHFGVQLRYHWLKEKDLAPGYMLQWTGVQVHTGYQFTKNKLTGNYLLEDMDPVQVDIGGGQTASANINDGQATALIEHSSHTIPLELSTGIRFLYLFTLYGGVGTDFTLSSKSHAGVTADATITGDYSFDVEGNQAADGKADFYNTRAFAGIQFNIPFVRVFAQGHKYFGGDTYGVNAGVKFLY